MPCRYASGRPLWIRRPMSTGTQVSDHPLTCLMHRTATDPLVNRGVAPRKRANSGIIARYPAVLPDRSPVTAVAKPRAGGAFPLLHHAMLMRMDATICA